VKNVKPLEPSPLVVGGVLLFALQLVYFSISRAPLRVGLVEMLLLSTASVGALVFALQRPWSLWSRLASIVAWLTLHAIARTAFLPTVVLKLERWEEGLFWGSLGLLGVASAGFLAVTVLATRGLHRFWPKR
jgi:hypothetical protein